MTAVSSAVTLIAAILAALAAFVGHPRGAPARCLPSISKRGPSFVSNREWQIGGAYCALDLAGVEATPPIPKEQGMPYLYLRLGIAE